MAVGDHFRLALLGGLAGQSIVSVWHYRQSTANTSAVNDVTSLANAFDDALLSTNALLDPLSHDVGYGIIESRSFPLPGTPPVGFDKKVAYLGSIATPALPPSVAAVIRRRTQYLGRAYRGRIFLAGLAAASVAGGIITAGGVLTDLVTLATAMQTPIFAAAAGSPTFVPELCKVVGPGPIYSYKANDITSTFVDPTLRSQRRREVGVGA